MCQQLQITDAQIHPQRSRGWYIDKNALDGYTKMHDMKLWREHVHETVGTGDVRLLIMIENSACACTVHKYLVGWSLRPGPTLASPHTTNSLVEVATSHR